VDGAGASSPLLLVALETRITENMTRVIRAHSWYRVPPPLHLLFTLKAPSENPALSEGARREERERGREKFIDNQIDD